MLDLWYNIGVKTQAKRVLKPAIIKKNWTRQRSDVTLSKELASALVRLVNSGQALSSSSGRIEVMLPSAEGYKAYILSAHTINSWIKRGNVIPETGETLSDVLDKAREDYRTKRIEDRRKKIVDEAEARLHRTLRIRTNVPIRDMFGKTIVREDGSLVRRENPALLRTQLDAVKFALERLNPDRYGKREKTEDKPLAFSLSDLRRAKEERDAQGIKNLS